MTLWPNSMAAARAKRPSARTKTEANRARSSKNAGTPNASTCATTCASVPPVVAANRKGCKDKTTKPRIQTATIHRSLAVDEPWKLTHHVYTGAKLISSPMLRIGMRYSAERAAVSSLSIGSVSGSSLSLNV